MSRPWSAEIWRIGAVVVASSLLGAMFGMAIPFMVMALAAYLAWYLRQLFRLERWLREGRRLEPPESYGIWGEVFHHVYRQQQRHLQRKRRLAGILNQYQKATSAMPDGIVVLGRNEEIQWFNETARQLLELHPSQDLGQRIDNLLRYPPFADYMARENFTQPLEIPCPCDVKVTLSVRVVPYGDEQRLLVVRDISERLRLEQMRRDFIGNVSHELRTPLTVISGFIETLSDSGDECARHWGPSLALMGQQSQRMQRLVDDLLLLSRLETDRDDSARAVVAVPALVAAIAEDARLLSGEKAHVLQVECDDQLMIRGAERELYSVFNNLVTNAIRYTPARGQITLRWFADEQGAHFSVTDTGIGIAREHLPRVTERFYRVDLARSRESGGTGLGLAIVKHALTRHDARLSIQSRPGKGSTFSCDFPSERIAPVALTGQGAAR